ncbi:MAG TPA: SDR family oxidoreductase [Candidatus Acidoferrales bacterium]|nr:SDR family oxidoreductase [Candidatus Acidoferrales bacterium]
MILATGAGGTVGSELVKQLRAAGVKFRAGYYSQAKADEARRHGMDGVALDFGRPETLGPALNGVERVFLISGNAPNQTELELNVVRAAKRAGVRHLVKSSVWGAQSEAFAFAKIHRPVEKEIEASGMAYTFLRPNGYMQNMHNFYAQTIREQRAFYLPARDARISHIDVRDIARVAVRALTETGHDGQAHDLSGPEALTYQQVAEKLSTVVGQRVSYVDVSDQAFKEGMVSAGAPAEAADALIELFHYYISGAAGRISPNVRRLAGTEPLSFDQYARDHATAFRPEARAAG